GDGARIPDLEGGRAVGGSSDRANRGSVALGRTRIDRRTMIAHVGYYEFVIDRVRVHAGRILDLGLGAFQHSGGSNIAGIRHAEHQNGICPIVGDVYLAMLFIQGNVRGPVQLRVRSFYDAQRPGVAARLDRINGNGGRLVSAGTGQHFSIAPAGQAVSAPVGVTSDVSVVGYEHPAILGVQADSMRVFQSGSVTAEHSEGFILTLGVLVVHNHHWRVLDGQKHFLAGFVDCNSIGPVWRAQFPRWMSIVSLVA